jgi:biotin carboxyl carrier protein
LILRRTVTGVQTCALPISVADRRFRVDVRGRDGRYVVTLDEQTLELDLVDIGGHCANLLVDGRSHEIGFERAPAGLRVQLAGGSFAVTLAGGAHDTRLAAEQASGPQRITAPMPGRIVQLLVRTGELVKAGQSLVVIEAMKMENELRSPRSGQVSAIVVSLGAAVEAGALLAVIS